MTTVSTSPPATVIDAWMQHPGQRWLDDEMFASLRRWKPGPFSETAQPVEATLEMMDRAGVGRGLLCAWWGPSGPMIGNDDVAALCATHAQRFAGVASVDLTRPMAAVAELRRCVETFGFRGLRRSSTICAGTDAARCCSGPTIPSGRPPTAWPTSTRSP